MSIIARQTLFGILFNHSDTKGSIFLHGPHHVAPNLIIINPGFTDNYADNSLAFLMLVTTEGI